MSTSSFDWKFGLTFLATLAGVVVPVALWQADLSAKTLALDVVSSTSLDPNAPQQLTGLAITIDGLAIPKAYLSVLQLKNSGSRPVAASEFETPIEISIEAPARVVRAEVTSTEPADLRPVLAVEGGVIRVRPLLLNPRDSVKLNVITADAPPVFLVRSRIAGVGAVSVSHNTTTKATRRAWAQRSIGVLLTSIYLVQMFQALEAFRRRSVVQLWTVCIALAAAAGGALLIFAAGATGDSAPELKDLLLHMVPSLLLGVGVIALRGRSGLAA